jgi:hypothetical protein
MTLLRTTTINISFPGTVSDNFCRNYSVGQTHSFISCPGGCSQTILQVKKPGQLLDMPNLSGKGCMLTNGDVNKLVQEFERNKLFVHLEHYWDLLFNLMKHGTNTLH